MSEIPITIPQAGVAMTEATIVEWHVRTGATVQIGEPIYTLETDKVEMGIDAPATGVIEIIADEGSTHPVGATVAILRPP